MNRKILSALVSITLVVILVAGLGCSAVAEAAKKAGVCWYNFSDTFISNARQTLLNIADADKTIVIADADSTGDQTVQADNMSNFFTQKVDYLVLNNINFGGISQIVNQCKEKGVPTIFANTTSPSDEDFANYDNLWYVSSDSRQSGTNMGLALADYIKNNPDKWDRNGNGKLDYILLQGIPTFSDTINRSSFSLAAIEEAGIILGKCIGGTDVTGVKGGDTINGVICDFSRAKAQENVEALLANFNKDIECVIADNDDEALGAIAALKAHGFFGDGPYVPVVGVDATSAGCEALKDGTMLETSLNNPVILSKCIYKVMKLLSEGKDVTTETMGFSGVVVEGHRVWMPLLSLLTPMPYGGEYVMYAWNDVPGGKRLKRKTTQYDLAGMLQGPPVLLHLSNIAHMHESAASLDGDSVTVWLTPQEVGQFFQESGLSFGNIAMEVTALEPVALLYEFDCNMDQISEIQLSCPTAYEYRDMRVEGSVSLSVRFLQIGQVSPIEMPEEAETVPFS